MDEHTIQLKIIKELKKYKDIDDVKLIKNALKHENVEVSLLEKAKVHLDQHLKDLNTVKEHLIGRGMHNSPVLRDVEAAAKQAAAARDEVIKVIDWLD